MASRCRRWYGEKRRTSASFVSPVNSHRRVSFVPALSLPPPPPPPALFPLFVLLSTACFRNARARLLRVCLLPPCLAAFRSHRAHQRSLFYATNYPENRRKILHLYVYRITSIPLSRLVSSRLVILPFESFREQLPEAFQIRVGLSPDSAAILLLFRARSLAQGTKRRRSVYRSEWSKKIDYDDGRGRGHERERFSFVSLFSLWSLERCDCSRKLRGEMEGS